MNTLLLFLLLMLPSVVLGQHLVINEVMASNSATIFDEDGDASDWIELYNPRGTPVSLAGFGSER